jgi:hypothetical protein
MTLRVEAAPFPAKISSQWSTWARLGLTRGDLAAQLALLLATLAFFWKMIRPFGSRWYMAEGDFSRQFYPFRFFEAQEWWHLRIPLWNPDLFAGHPFQADVQTAVFYPPALANAIVFGRRGFPFVALEAEVVVHTFLAGVFTYWLARRLTGSRLSALVSGIAFAFSGFITTYPAEQLPLLETAIWLPLIVLFLEMAAPRLPVGDHPASKPEGAAPAWGAPEAALGAGHPSVAVGAIRVAVGWRWISTAGLIFGIAILAGHPQTVLFIAYATGGFVVWRLWRAGVRWWESAAAAVLYGLVAAGVAAVQVLPTLEFLPYSTRDQMSYAEAAWGYLPSALWEIFVPLWHGEKALSVGVVALALAVLGAWASRREPLAYWTVAGLVAIPLSLGGATPLFWVLYHVAPGWDLFRDQERVIYIFAFAASLLAGRGTAELQQRDRRTALVKRVALLSLAASVVFGALYVGGPAIGISSELRANVALNTIVLALMAAFLFVGARIAGLAHRVRSLPVLAVLPVPGRFAAPRGRPGGEPEAVTAAAVLGVGLVVLVAAELFSINLGNNLSPTSPNPAPRFQQTADFIHAFPEPFRVRGISEKVFPSDYGMVLGLPTIGGDTPFQIRRMRDMLAADADWRVWQILNVKFFISDGGPLAGLNLVFQDGALKTYFMSDSLPRAWAVRAVEVAHSPDQARQLILAPGYHPGNVVVLEREPSIGPFAPGPRPDVRITHLDPQRIAIDADASGAAMLVLAQQYYPDWQAYRDGQPVPIFRANYLAMAFELPAGKHHFEIVYRPWSFYLGATISLVTIGVVVAVLGWSWKRRPESAR